jgi:uncharacterized protein (DUF2336 family)
MDMPVGSENGFDGLLKLARDKSVEGRTRLVQSVGDLFFDTDKVLTDRERSLMTEILRQLIHDVEMSVRKALSKRLASEDAAPKDLIQVLANDEIEVAFPILRESSVLQDIDLIEIIQHRTMNHQLAVAMRDSLSESVSDALVEAGNADVIKSLLDNNGAEISARTMEYLVDQSKTIDAYQNPLLHRKDLGSELARRMYWWVSAALREHIVDAFELSPEDLEEYLEDAVGDLVVEGAAHGQQSKGAALAGQLKQENKITPELLVETLRQGEVSLFEDLFAELTGLRPKLVRRFIFEPGGQGLAVACKAVSIAKSEFASIFLLSRSARPGEKIVDPDELSGVLAFFDGVQPLTAKKVLKRWHRDPDFLFALKQLETSQGGKRAS